MLRSSAASGLVLATQKLGSITGGGTEGKGRAVWNGVQSMLADLASALAARDPATAAHCARVTFVARRLAAWLDWDERKLRTVEVGAPLHDIGKVTISEALL